MKNQVWQDETVQALKQGYQEVIDKQITEITGLREWKQAIDDACTLDWIEPTTPKETIQNLISTNIKQALDPAISEQPAKWIARITELEKGVFEMRKCVAENAGIRNEYQDFEEVFEIAQNLLQDIPPLSEVINDRT